MYTSPRRTGTCQTKEKEWLGKFKKAINVARLFHVVSDMLLFDIGTFAPIPIALCIMSYSAASG